MSIQRYAPGFSLAIASETSGAVHVGACSALASASDAREIFRRARSVEKYAPTCTTPSVPPCMAAESGGACRRTDMHRYGFGGGCGGVGAGVGTSCHWLMRLIVPARVT